MNMLIHVQNLYRRALFYTEEESPTSSYVYDFMSVLFYDALPITHSFPATLLSRVCLEHTKYACRRVFTLAVPSAWNAFPPPTAAFAQMSPSEQGTDYQTHLHHHYYF